MGVAGALIATPGFQAMGAGMAGSLVADHVGNIIGEEDFSAADNIVSGSIGAGAGYYGALATAGMSLVPAMVTTTVIGATMPIVAKSMGNHFSGTNYYDIEEELDEAIPNGASSGASTALSIATSPLLGTTGADVFANVATEIIKTEMEYCGEEICQR
jgi:hypothetical protein